MQDNMKTDKTDNDNAVVDIVFILDSSGSMDALGKEPVQGVRNFIEDLRKQKSEENINFYLTLTTFNNTTKIIYDNIDIDSVEEFGDDKYLPDGMTALYDAIGKTIHNYISKKESGDRKVICVILTDGEENSSFKYTRDQIKELTQSCEKKGWSFKYLGANQDSFNVANSIGINNSADYDYTDLGCRNIMRTVSETVRQLSSEYSDRGRLKIPAIKRCLAEEFKDDDDTIFTKRQRSNAITSLTPPLDTTLDMLQRNNSEIDPDVFKSTNF
jgi:uncharacterized protein YegL